MAKSADPDQLANWSGSTLQRQGYLDQHCLSFINVPEFISTTMDQVIWLDPDQLASDWSGSALFVIYYVNLYQQPGSSNLTGWKLEVGVAS